MSPRRARRYALLAAYCAAGARFAPHTAKAAREAAVEQIDPSEPKGALIADICAGGGYLVGLVLWPVPYAVATLARIGRRAVPTPIPQAAKVARAAEAGAS